MIWLKSFGLPEYLTCLESVNLSGSEIGPKTSVALHAFGYGDDPAEIKAKRYRNASRLFKRNELQRAVFDQLRLNPKGIDTTALTDRIMRQKGWDTGDSKFRGAVAHKVGNLLWRLRKRRLVSSKDDGAVNVWRLS
jgi:hypothetical protein